MELGPGPSWPSTRCLWLFGSLHCLYKCALTGTGKFLSGFHSALIAKRSGFARLVIDGRFASPPGSSRPDFATLRERLCGTSYPTQANCLEAMVSPGPVCPVR